MWHIIVGCVLTLFCLNYTDIIWHHHIYWCCTGWLSFINVGVVLTTRIYCSRMMEFTSCFYTIDNKILVKSGICTPFNNNHIIIPYLVIYLVSKPSLIVQSITFLPDQWPYVWCAGSSFTKSQFLARVLLCLELWCSSHVLTVIGRIIIISTIF